MRKRVSLSSKEKPAIEQAIDAALSAQLPTSGGVEIRASSLPFCPRRYCLDRLVATMGGFRSFFGEACMNQGTALHSTVQDYLGRAGLLWGHWVCFRCDERIERTQGPVACPKCKSWMTYEELSLSHPCGLTGHCDGVLPSDNAVLEVKGSNMWTMKKLTAPVWYHMYQASCYLYMANAHFGLGLDKIVFVYIDRGIPANRKVFIRSGIRSLFDQTVKMVQEANVELADERISTERICETQADGREVECMYHELCFMPDDQLRKLQRIRNKQK